MVDIRIAFNEADAMSASQIYALSWKAAYRGIFSDELLDGVALDRWVPFFNSNYETHRFEVAILSVNGEDMGAGGYGLSRDYPDENIGEIASMYFLEKAWGKEYAALLMDFMLGRLKEKGYDRFHVWVLKENHRARRFYEKCGFLQTGNEKEVTVRGEMQIDVEYAK